MNDNPNSTRRVNIPAWMLEKNTYTDNNKSSNTRFLRNTLLGISKVIQNEIFSERFVQNGKFLQSVDPRVKLMTLLFFMIFCGLTRSILTLIFLVFVSAFYTKLSGLNFKDYLKRVWMVLPLLVFLISIPAATNLFINGKPLFYIYNELDFKLWILKFPSELYVSLEGIKAVLIMTLRVGVSFSFGYMLVMTTRWIHLTKSLSALRLPLLVISILNMTYRYIFVLSNITCEMIESRFLRTVGRINNKENRMFIANRISFLFVKSSFLSDEIYDSMRCRGYTGEPVCLTNFKMGMVDYLWIFNNIIVSLILIAGEILL